jgi:hypothetical protein
MIKVIRHNGGTSKFEAFDRSSYADLLYRLYDLLILLSCSPFTGCYTIVVEEGTKIDVSRINHLLDTDLVLFVAPEVELLVQGFFLVNSVCSG